MSNNPLEAVTQAVNSLVTALKLPDESAKANEVLGEMSFPQFSRLLPYRDYNQESGLFMNDTTTVSYTHLLMTINRIKVILITWLMPR